MLYETSQLRQIVLSLRGPQAGVLKPGGHRQVCATPRLCSPGRSNPDIRLHLRAGRFKWAPRDNGRCAPSPARPPARPQAWQRKARGWARV